MEVQLQTLAMTEQDAITAALVRVIKESPVFEDSIIQVSDASKAGSVGVFPSQGAVYLEKYLNNSFLAAFPFYILYRTKPGTDAQKISGAAKLEALAAWLEQRPVLYKGKTYRLSLYPELTADREIQDISRTSTVFVGSVENSDDILYRVDFELTYFKDEED